MQKKAQSGMNAAFLVAIVATLIILYVIFLPNTYRDQLINQNKGIVSSTGTSQSDQQVLLRAFPGTLSTAKGLEDEKKIPNIFLVETTNAKDLESINPFIVSNGWFDKKTKSVDFSLEDPDNTDNALLSFGVKKKQGILTIKLNGNVIFENEITSDVPEPVKLEKKLLRKTNALQFEVSGVGAKFWTTNEYQFDNVKIVGDITDTSRQESLNVFTITDSEFNSMDKANLKFTPYCSSVRDLGILAIIVNNKRLFSSVPVCDTSYMQSLPKTVLNVGENNVVFKTTKGSYSVEQIKAALVFKEPQLKTYYFELNDTLWNEVKSGSKDVALSLKFADDAKNKRAKLDVNGRAETIETSKGEFSKSIKNKVGEGNNYVRLEPIDDIEVVELLVEAK